MSIGNLPDNKLMSLALQGYNPFQPDCGIFCGGYQGLLYPNPTTLVYPSFDPYLYTNPTASEYEPDVQYTGLGIGNPGIDYKNPGHILGLLDTFGRMSYGIGVLQAIHEGNDGDGGISPIVNISLPVINISEDDVSTLSLGDIYPFLSEIPADWINGFTVAANGQLTPDPRPMALFPPFVYGHTPVLNSVDAEQLNRLFATKTIFSYIGMPQYLRAVIEYFASAAANLANKTNLEFIVDSPHIFNTYCHQPSFFPNINILNYHVLNQEGNCINQCKILSPYESLKMLTGEGNYHNGQDGQNEYRSLTELNSVINIVPIQTVGATYWLDDHSYREVYPPGGEVEYEVDEWTFRLFQVASYMISDLVINISDIPPNPDNPEPGTVTIDGTVTIKSIITDPTAYHWTLTRREFLIPPPGPITTIIFGNAQSYKKTAHIVMSMTNQFTWDRTWLNTGLITDEDYFYDQKDEATETGGDSDVGFILLDQSDLVIPFSKTFTLAPGCNSIRMRIFGRNRHLIGQAGPHMVDPRLWVDPLSPNPGVHYCGYVDGEAGGPDAVPGEIETSNIELSFTITGANIDPIVCEVST